MYDPSPAQVPNTVEEEMILLLFHMVTTCTTVYLRPQCNNCLISTIVDTRYEWVFNWSNDHKAPDTEEDRNMFLRDWVNHVKKLSEKCLKEPCTKENKNVN